MVAQLITFTVMLWKCFGLRNGRDWFAHYFHFRILVAPEGLLMRLTSSEASTDFILPQSLNLPSPYGQTVFPCTSYQVYLIDGGSSFYCAWHHIHQLS
jgi:hypothetical protein